MASGSSNRKLVARAAAILTNAEVAATQLDLNECWGSKCELQVDLTLGSLTNAIVKVYVSEDGVTWVEHRAHTGAAVTMTLTASGSVALPIDAPGWRFVRASVQGTGTVTASSATVTHRYLRRLSQG